MSEYGHINGVHSFAKNFRNVLDRLRPSRKELNEASKLQLINRLTEFRHSFKNVQECLNFADNKKRKHEDDEDDNNVVKRIILFLENDDSETSSTQTPVKENNENDYKVRREKIILATDEDKPHRVQKAQSESDIKFVANMINNDKDDDENDIKLVANISDDDHDDDDEKEQEEQTIRREKIILATDEDKPHRVQKAQSENDENSVQNAQDESDIKLVANMINDDGSDIELVASMINYDHDDDDHDDNDHDDDDEKNKKNKPVFKRFYVKSIQVKPNVTSCI
ncbi:hypothetical protein HELRODRAFT_184403 [Helobdella robusta]|uniref:Uncharacterized protein n=1 Tax=Helobdella robusta TaxID=6412 RepID=T1FL48_HELRO|nr:hypothetical protein HELRODRAFT_184403 [Helobdella robusta]ESN98376.1 hypothetical protein HELRODRAFT_184403 [Helobdella robusta]